MAHSYGAIGETACEPDRAACTSDALDQLEKAVSRLHEEYRHIDELADSIAGSVPRPAVESGEKGGSVNCINERAYRCADKLGRLVSELSDARHRIQRGVHG